MMFKVNVKTISSILLIVFVLVFTHYSTSVSAAKVNSGGSGTQNQTTQTKSNCNEGTCVDPAADPKTKCDKDNCDFVKKYVNPAINLFSMVFGLIAVSSLIFGGIQYSASAGDPQNVAKAKKRIIDTIIAIVAYFFLYAFIQFLVPGGLF